MTVNGIPDDYLNTMEKNVRNFIWLGTKGSIPWRRAVLPRDEGGLGAPSPKIIYETTKVMWLKRFYLSTKNRPKWTFIANDILQRCMRKSGQRVETTAVTEWIEQTWRVNTRSPELPNFLKAIIKAATKYNVRISVLRAPLLLKLKMPAFHHLAASSKRLNNSRRAKCLRDNHHIVTIEDLIFFAEVEDPNVTIEQDCENGVDKCKDTARRILRNLSDTWNPIPLSPIRNNLYHTQRRLEKYSKVNIKEEPILFNPDPQDKANPIENVRIFGIRKGYTQTSKDSETPKLPLRIMQTPHTRHHEKQRFYTDGSATLNGWENCSAGIGIWHKPGSDWNTEMKLEGLTRSNQRAELAAIAQILRVNPRDDIVILSDSLTSLTAITKDITKWEDIGWTDIKNADLLKEILAHLRTRYGTCEFQWIKAHANNVDNCKADELAKAGQNSNDIFIEPDHYPYNKRAIHDGARLSSITFKIAYKAIARLEATKEDPPKNDTFPDTQEMVKLATNLTPSREAIIRGIWNLKVPLRIRDLLWQMNISRIKCGEYWRNIPGFKDREFCLACQNNGEREITESQHHLWLDCRFNGQELAWKTAKQLWTKTTTLPWPTLSIGALRGVGAITLSDADGNPIRSHDSERLRILLCITLWAIWKSRNKLSIQNMPVAATETSNLLRLTLRELMTNSWNATHLEINEHTMTKKRTRLTSLWSGLATFTRGKHHNFHF